MDLERLRSVLAADLGRVDEYFGRALADPRTQLTELAAPFFSRTRVFVGERFLPTRPLLVYLGHHESGQAFLLNGQPDEFNRMVEAEGLRVEGFETAIQLARLFLDCTQPQDERFLLVSHADELPWMPGEDPARIESARRELARHLAPPTARGGPGGSYAVDFCVVHDRALEIVTVEVSPTGQLQATARTVIPQLPLAYAGG
jgi:hypothetical protein